MMAALTFARVSFLVFVHYIEFLHDFLLDILVSDNLWFFAPLLWMILTYITLYLRRRSFLFRQVQQIFTPNFGSTLPVTELRSTNLRTKSKGTIQYQGQDMLKGNEIISMITKRLHV